MSSCLLTTAWIWSRDLDPQRSIFLKSSFMVIFWGWDWPECWCCIQKLKCFPRLGCWHCWETEWVRRIETTTQTVSGEIWRIMTPESWLESRWLMTSCTVIVRTCHKRKFISNQIPFSSWPLNLNADSNTDHSIVGFSLNSCSRFSRSFVRFFWFGLVNKQTCQLTQWFFSLSKNAVSSSI